MNGASYFLKFYITMHIFQPDTIKSTQNNTSKCLVLRAVNMIKRGNHMTRLGILACHFAWSVWEYQFIVNTFCNTIITLSFNAQTKSSVFEV